MEKILSQEEVDALLRGLTSGEIEAEGEEESPGDGVRPCDLTSQDRIIRERMPTLEIINDRFARLHRVTLSGSLRRIVDISVTQPKMVKFGDLIRTLPVPTSLHILKMDPLRGHALLVAESRLIFNLVDCFFGGTGRSNFIIEGRDFTSIEHRVIDKVVQTAVKDLNQSWTPVVPINFRLSRSEVNPQFAAIVPPSDLVIVMHFELKLDRLIGRMILCLPYSTIEPIRSKLHASFQSDRLDVDVEWMDSFRARLHDVKVDLQVQFGKTRITGRDLLELDIGDTILLDQDAGEPLIVKVQGVTKFKATPGVFKGNQAFQILEAMDPPAV